MRREVSHGIFVLTCDAQGCGTSSPPITITEAIRTRWTQYPDTLCPECSELLRKREEREERKRAKETIVVFKLMRPAVGGSCIVRTKELIAALETEMDGWEEGQLVIEPVRMAREDVDSLPEFVGW